MKIKNITSRFKTHKMCIEFLEKILWENEPVCPYCKTQFFSISKREERYHCNKCNSSFSVTVGTMFHRTKCDLRKWFLAIRLLSNSPSISARDLGDILKVTKDTAWLMTNKIKLDKKNFDIISSELIKELP